MESWRYLQLFHCSYNRRADSVFLILNQLRWIKGKGYQIAL